MPRFVLLRHEMPPGDRRASHWDLMLEADDGLRTWALAGLPEDAKIVTAEALPIHRKQYLNYEGPISDGRGEVFRQDAGEFEMLADEEGLVSLRLRGHRLHGRLNLWVDDDEQDQWKAAYYQEPAKSPS